MGWGHTSQVWDGMVISDGLGDELLRNDLHNAELAVANLIDVPLTSNQRSALISFTFNVGAGNLQRSTLRKKLLAGDYDAVPDQLLRWTKGGGKVLPGLVRRRKAEAKLWSSS